MLRSTQEKNQLVRKFEEIAPFLKGVKKFGWTVPECDRDPVYHIHPDTSDPGKLAFKSLTVNVKTGWYGEYIYRDERGVHRVREGIAQIKDEWSDYCYRSNCVCKDK